MHLELTCSYCSVERSNPFDPVLELRHDLHLPYLPLSLLRVANSSFHSFTHTLALLLKMFTRPPGFERFNPRTKRAIMQHGTCTPLEHAADH